MSTPRSAPRPLPTMIAVGVANPSAQGQAMMRTATKFMTAKLSRGSGPNASQTPNVSTATPTTAGTNHKANLSAWRWTGALVACACRTRSMIRASAVCAPTLVVRKRNVPVVFMVAAMTASPARFSTGTLSPVNRDSSTSETPSSTTPSTGIRSPGRTSTRSPA